MTTWNISPPTRVALNNRTNCYWKNSGNTFGYCVKVPYPTMGLSPKANAQPFHCVLGSIPSTRTSQGNNQYLCEWYNTVDGTSNIWGANWLQNHFPALTPPFVGYAFNTPYKIPLITNGGNFAGLDMPTVNNATFTDALGDTPSTFNITQYLTYTYPHLSSVATTTNVTASWIIDELGDGSFGTWTASGDSYSTVLDADFCGTLRVGPLIKKITCVWNTSTNEASDVEYEYAYYDAYTTSFHGLTNSDANPL